MKLFIHLLTTFLFCSASTLALEEPVKAQPIFADGWMPVVTSLELTQCTQLCLLEFSIELTPSLKSNHLQLTVNNEAPQDISLQPGLNKIIKILDGKPGAIRVQLSFSSSDKLSAADNRYVAGRLASIAVTPITNPPSRRIYGTPDIQQVEIIFLSGWSPIEVFQNQTFRWVGGKASFIFPPALNCDKSVILSVVAKPGPGVNGLPAEICLLDGHDRLVDKCLAQTQSRLEFTVPPNTPQPLSFLTKNGGKVIPQDPRILDVQFFEIALGK